MFSELQRYPAQLTRVVVVQNGSDLTQNISGLLRHDFRVPTESTIIEEGTVLSGSTNIDCHGVSDCNFDIATLVPHKL